MSGNGSSDTGGSWGPGDEWSNNSSDGEASDHNGGNSTGYDGSDEPDEEDTDDSEE